jgi:hypothetical protein
MNLAIGLLTIAVIVWLACVIGGSLFLAGRDVVRWLRGIPRDPI